MMNFDLRKFLTEIDSHNLVVSKYKISAHSVCFPVTFKKTIFVGDQVQILKKPISNYLFATDDILREKN